jgi:2,4-dienoyl-CoA reductase-like NADH-dependent reductase (Old Yellow Enzyme family)
MAPVLDPTQRALVDNPLALGPIRVKNRVFVAPHTTNFGIPGENLVTSRHLDYHRARARGGAGLIITEGIRVHPTSLRRLGIHAYSDAALPGLRKLAETVHGEGTTIFGQLLHTGRHSGDEHAGSWGPEPVPWSTTAPVPHVMNRFDIRTLVDCFAASTRRLIDAGFDGFEIHIGHGHLLHQFLSPVTNHRDDEYGGSPERRARLALEVVRAVRDAAAGRVAVGVRLSASEFLPGGLDPDSVLEIVASLEDGTPFDFLHVSHAAYIGTSSLSTQMADMSYGPAPFIEFARQFRAAFPRSPVLAICRIEDLAMGAEILERGDADMVGFARGHIAEPRLFELSVAGEGARSCIACNQGCNANLEAITPITCTVNPAVGREAEWDVASAASAQPRRVLVVGAGPGGMEAAAAAASHGHDVTLVDERDSTGGQLLDFLELDGRPGFHTLLDELRAQLARAGVEPVLGSRWDAQQIAQHRPDVVILATGARHGTSPLQDRLGVPVLDAEDVIRDPTQAGHRTVVLDESGVWEASGLAMHLARRGVETVLVSPVAGFAQRVTVYSRLALADQLIAAGVAVRSTVSVERRDGALALVSSLADTVEALPGVESIVHVRPRRSHDPLVDELTEFGWAGDLYTVGDAFAPRTAQEAIAEGRGVGLILGVEDPQVASGIRMRQPYRYPLASGGSR